MASTLHLIAPFHDVPAAASSQNAFSAQALTFPGTMRGRGYHVIEYANEGSEAMPDERCEMLTAPSRQALFPHGLPLAGSAGWRLFDAKLRAALAKHAAPGDIVLHTFGAPHAALVTDMPQLVHLEPFVGYLDKPFGARRIYQSEAWRNYHFGLADAHSLDSYQKRETWTIPMGFDTARWPLGTGAGNYVLFFGRLLQGKGLDTVAELVQRTAWQFRLVGAQSRECTSWYEGLTAEAKARVSVLPPVTGAARAEILGNARCTLMPTVHVEPFGAGGVESMLCGTPLIASDWGGFVETVLHGTTGFRCRTVPQYIDAIERSGSLDRLAVAEQTRDRFSLDRVGAMFDEVFKQL